MSKTANLSLNPASNKWEASFGGKVIVSSADKKYVIHVITKGLNTKAKNLGITKIDELGVATDDLEAHVEPAIVFDINERFGFLRDTVDMVATRDMASAVIVGEGGLGKSFTVMSQLAKNGLRNLDDLEIGASLDNSNSRSTYLTIKGYSTPKALFRTLYEHRDRTIVFDDCDSILKNDDATNVLKGALDSYSRRIVSWCAESPFGESDLPRSFEFTGAVIFISNMSMHKIPQAILSRSAPVDVSMSRAEIIARMRQIVAEGEFMAEVDMELKQDALNLIAQNINNPQIRAINLRTLIKVVTNRRCKPDNWQRLSLSLMIAER